MHRWRVAEDLFRAAMVGLCDDIFYEYCRSQQTQRVHVLCAFVCIVFTLLVLVLVCVIVIVSHGKIVSLLFGI